MYKDRQMYKKSKKRNGYLLWKTFQKYKIFIQNNIDLSNLRRYYRDSFWIKKLYKSQKQKYSQKTPHSTKEPVFLAVAGSFSCHKKDFSSFDDE